MLSFRTPNMLNMLRTVLFSLLMAASAVAQFTLPDSFMPLMPSAAPLMAASAPKGSDPTPIACGSIVSTSVTFTSRIMVTYTATAQWPPVGWETWTDEDRETYQDQLAYDAVFTVPSTLAHYANVWGNTAKEMAMRDFVCDPCPIEQSSECLMSASATFGSPVTADDIHVLTITEIGGTLFILADFTLHYNVWVECDTKEGCR